MTVISTLPIDQRTISTAGTVTLQVTAGKVTITLYKNKKEKGKTVLKEISSGTYAANQQGFSDTLVTETDVQDWKVSVKGENSLSAMNLTLP